MSKLSHLYQSWFVFLPTVKLIKPVDIENRKTNENKPQHAMRSCADLNEMSAINYKKNLLHVRYAEKP